MATTFEEIQTEKVRPNKANIRQDMGDMETLSAEVKSFGIRSPLVVYPHPEISGDYLVQDGHRRLQAARTTGMLFIPCIVIDAPKRGVREDIEVMLTTGRGAKVLNPLEVSAGFEQLVADGMDETTIGKKYKIPKSEVLARAKIMEAPTNLRDKFALGSIDLVTMKRIQDLENTVASDVFDAVVAESVDALDHRRNLNVERIIVESEIKVARIETTNRLDAIGAVKGNRDVSFSGKHDRVTDKMTDAEHVAAGHVWAMAYNSADPAWYAKRVTAKAALTAEEKAEKQLRQSMDATLAIQARVRRKFLADQVQAKDGGAGASADFDLLFGVLFDSIRNADDELLADLSGIALPAEDSQEDPAKMNAWTARVEKKFRSFTWQQLSRAAAIVAAELNEIDLAKSKGFQRDRYEWRSNREWLTTLQEKFGYSLDQSERNAVLWGEVEGGSHYNSGPITEGENRNLEMDLVIVNGE